MPEGPLGGAFVEIHADLDAFEAELRAKLEELTGQGGDVKINVDADTGAAEADLEAVKVEADRAGENQTIRVDADTAAANAQLLETQAAADAASGSSFGGVGGGGLSGLVSAGLALSPALVPAAAASAAGIGALASLTGIAAVGIGSFAALAIPSFQGVGKEVETISKDQTALNDALTQQDKNQAIHKLQEDLSKIPPEQRPVVQGILDLKQSLDNVSASIRPQIFGAFESFLNAGKTLLPQLGPPAQQAALAFTDIGNALNRAFQSQGFHEFMGWVTGQVRGALDSIGIAIGNVARGFGGLLEAFAPLVPGLEGGMDRITASFARWATNLGSSQGFQRFLQYFHDNGAAVSSLIKDVAQAVESIVKAAAGFGGVEIRILDEIAKAINAIASIPGIGPAAVDIALLAAALQKLGLLSVISGGLRGLGADAEAGAAGAASLSTRLGALATTVAPLLAIVASLGFLLQNTAEKNHQAGDASEDFRKKAVNNISSIDQLNGALGSATQIVDSNTGAWWNNGSILTNWADSHKRVHDAFAPVQTDLINAKGHVEALSQQWGTSADAVLRGAQIMGVSIHDLGNKGHDAQVAFGVSIDAIEQKLGTLPPDAAQAGKQAEDSLTNAIRFGQAPSAASTNTQQIIDAYNNLNKIPGLGAQALDALRNNINIHGALVGQATTANVNDLIGHYNQLPPNIQQAALQAMAELNAGLATGNQNAINDATFKLAQLTGNYQAIIAPVSKTGVDAGAGFVSGLIGQMTAGLGTLDQAMAAYDAALAKGLNPLLSAIGAKTFGPGSEVPFFQAATGAIITSPQVLVGEEAPQHPEVVIATNPAYRARNLALYAQAGKMLGLAGGGIINPESIDISSAFWDPSQVPKPPDAALLAHGNVPGAAFGWATDQEATQIYQAAVKFVASLAASRNAAGSGIGGSGPPVTSAACADLVAQGLALPGANAGFGAACMQARLMNESGCSTAFPHANMSDSNAARGTPSVGIAQFVPSTFASVSCPGCTDISNPLCQICASSHCSPGNCGHGGYGCATGGILGLANGGIVTSPTLSVIGERGPEAVVPLGHGGAFGGNVTIDARIVFNGDVTDNIDARIQRAHAAQADRITRKLGLRGVTPAPGGNLR